MKEINYVAELLPYMPEFLNVVIAITSMHYLFKLEGLRIGKAKATENEELPSGFWASLAWLGAKRLPQLIIAGIAIPDIPVLVKLITG